MCILLFLDRIPYRYILIATSLMCHLRPLFPNWFFCVDNLSTDVCEVLKLCTIIVLLWNSPFICFCLLYIFSFLSIRYIYVNEYYILFFIDFFVFIMSLFVFYYRLTLLYFAWYEYCYTSFLFSSIFMNIFSIPSLSVCVL